MTYFLVGCVLYSSYIALSSYKPAHDTSWYVPVGLCIAVLANMCWLFLTRTLKNANEVLLAAIWWDAMVVGVSIAIPILIFGAQPTKWQIIGIVLVITGIMISHKS
jgi:uncharacterized membrane protein